MPHSRVGPPALTGPCSLLSLLVPFLLAQANGLMRAFTYGTMGPFWDDRRQYIDKKLVGLLIASSFLYPVGKKKSAVLAVGICRGLPGTYCASELANPDAVHALVHCWLEACSQALSGTLLCRYVGLEPAHSQFGVIERDNMEMEHVRGIRRAVGQPVMWREGEACRDALSKALCLAAVAGSPCVCRPCRKGCVCSRGNPECRQGSNIERLPLLGFALLQIISIGRHL